MPWVVGIDEAGYGPNLGPLVQAAVAVRLPDEDPAGWNTLRPVVRQAHEKADGRLLIDDSKKVYTRGGVGALETGVFLGLGLRPGPFLGLLHELAVPTEAVDVGHEVWCEAGESLPRHLGPEARADLLGVTGTVSPVVRLVTPLAFNRLCDEAGSKGAVPARGLVSLLSVTRNGIPGDGEPVRIFCDKLGGRNYYAALVQQAFPDGWVVAETEGAQESRYRVDGLDRAVSVTFCPRADGGSVAVALASMLCKYLREVCMLQFNRFWAKHVPGLKPTAGYPVDARRFYEQIRPAMANLGLIADQVWRKR